MLKKNLNAVQFEYLAFNCNKMALFAKYKWISCVLEQLLKIKRSLSVVNSK